MIRGILITVISGLVAGGIFAAFKRKTLQTKKQPSHF